MVCALGFGIIETFASTSAYIPHSTVAGIQSLCTVDFIILTDSQITLPPTTMYIAASELLIKPDKKTLASQYHDSLLPHLHAIPGFIRESRYVSSNVPNQVLILSWWEDAAAIGRWRNQSNHLRIQEKGSRDVFLDYRLRIGPAHDADQNVLETGLQVRAFLVLYWRPKQAGQALSIAGMSELKDGTVAGLKAAMLDDATYEDEASVLRLSGWASRADASLYEESVARVEGDKFERVCVARNYSKEQRGDAPHYKPGKQHGVSLLS